MSFTLWEGAPGTHFISRQDEPQSRRGRTVQNKHFSIHYIVVVIQTELSRVLFDIYLNKGTLTSYPPPQNYNLHTTLPDTTHNLVRVVATSKVCTASMSILLMAELKFIRRRCL
jgi:hypothetical protein